MLLLDVFIWDIFELLPAWIPRLLSSLIHSSLSPFIQISINENRCWETGNSPTCSFCFILRFSVIFILVLLFSNNLYVCVRTCVCMFQTHYINIWGFVFFSEVLLPRAPILWVICIYFRQFPLWLILNSFPFSPSQRRKHCFLISWSSLSSIPHFAVMQGGQESDSCISENTLYHPYWFFKPSEIFLRQLYAYRKVSSTV